MTTVTERVEIPVPTDSSGRKISPGHTPGHTLDGRLTYPETGRPTRAVLVLPPHPHFGGDQDNNVVRALVRGLVPRGNAVLTVDYRGVGGSTLPTGSASGAVEESAHDFWHRVEEEGLHDEVAGDAVAALDFLTGLRLGAAHGGAAPAIVGYSFGAILAGLAARRRAAAALALLAPPLRRHPCAFLTELTLPRLLLLAAQDFLYGPAEIARLEALAPPRRLESVPGADHFFRGHEDEAARRVASFLDTVDPPSLDPAIHRPATLSARTLLEFP